MTFERDQLVYDTVNDAMVVVRYHNKETRADEWAVREGKTVAEWEGNEEFPDDDDVVGGVYLGDMYGEPKRRPQVFDFPETRLSAVYDHSGGNVMYLHTEKGATDLEPVEGVGACGNCGEAITEKNDEYIEGQNDNYCSVNCYNEALQ